MTRILGLDTATEACSVALWQDGALISRFESVGRHHSERLLPMLQSVLDEAGCTLGEIDAFACGVGPGSFVGVRVGVGVVKGIAMALDRPCIPLSSLELLALGARGAVREGIAVAIDARMSEIYFAAYTVEDERRLRCIAEPAVCVPSAVPPGLPVCKAVGTGWSAYPAGAARLPEGALQRPEALHLPSVAAGMDYAAAMLASQTTVLDAAALEPVYLRNQIALTLVEQRAARASAQTDS